MAYILASLFLFFFSFARHHEKWAQLKLVLKSREKLIAYCEQLTGELRPADASDDFAVTVSP
jgi:hypothetical protein